MNPNPRFLSFALLAQLCFALFHIPYDYIDYIDVFRTPAFVGIG